MRNTVLDLFTWIKTFRIYAKTTSSIEARENLIDASNRLEKIAGQLITGKNEKDKPVTVADTAQSMLHLWRKIHKQEWRYATLNVLDDGGNQCSLILSLIRDCAENLLKGDYVEPNDPIDTESLKKEINPIGICRHCNRVIEMRSAYCPSCREKITEDDVLPPPERQEKSIEIILGDDFEQMEVSTIFLLNDETEQYECRKCGFAPFEAGITKDAKCRNLKKCPSCSFRGTPAGSLKFLGAAGSRGQKKPRAARGFMHRHKKADARAQKTVEIKIPYEEGDYRGISRDSSWPCDGSSAGRNGFSNGLGSRKGSVKWTLPLTPDLTSPPVVDKENNVYIGTMGGGFLKVKPDGSFEWIFLMEEDIVSSACIDASGYIYFSVPGKTYKLNPDGSPRGIVREGSDFAPVLDRKGNLFIISEGNLVCVAPDRGVKWKASLGPGVEEIIHDLTPVVGPEGNIYVSTNHLLGFSQTGKDLFKVPLMKRGTRPTVDHRGIVYVGTENRLLAVRNNGSVMWQKDFRDYVNTPIATYKEDRMFFGTLNTGCVYCITDTGGVIWEYRSDGPITAPLSVDEKGNVYFVNQNSKIYSINPKGKLRWEYSTKSMGFFGGGLFNSAPAVGKDGLTYASCQDGKLYAFV